MSQTVYARVDAGKIVEYPVYEIHIVNRAHPKDWYVEVERSAHPETTVYQYVSEKLELVGKRAVLSYEVKDHELAHLFSMVYNTPDRVASPLDGTSFGFPKANLGAPVATLPDMFISTAPVGYAEALAAAVDKFVTQRLTDFVLASGFSSIVSLVSYKDSTVPEWSALANEFIVMRDLTWTTVIDLQRKLTAGEVAIPKSLSDFVALLPDLSYTPKAA